MKKSGLYFILVAALAVCMIACSAKTDQEMFDDYETSFEKDQFFDAIASLDVILLKDSTSLLLYHARGISNQRANEYDSAIKDFSKALEINNEDVFALTQRANAYTMKGEYKNAIDDYNRAIVIRGFNTANDDTIKKYKVKNKKLFEVPLLFDIVYLRGKAYYETFDLIRAIDDFNLCIETSLETSMNSKFDKIPDCYYWRGCTYARLGELNRACEDFHIAAESGINKAFADIEENCREVSE